MVKIKIQENKNNTDFYAISLLTILILDKIIRMRGIYKTVIVTDLN